MIKPIFHHIAKLFVLVIHVGYYTQCVPSNGARIGLIHSMLFVSISFAFGSQCKCAFWGNICLGYNDSRVFSKS